MYQIFSGHDFAEFQKLCNFMSVNLDNSMMKHLKQKLIAFVYVLRLPWSVLGQTIPWFGTILWWAIPILS